MTATRLTTRTLEKVWGRHDLWPGFTAPVGMTGPIGEIWFEDPRSPENGGGDPDLLVKYLFTAEKLSVQVHPDDAMAQGMGLPRGKDEAWVVLDATPDATIGIGLRRELTPGELRAAALDGSIEDMLDWRSVSAGDVYFSPSGTIHAIGAGVTVIEVQQNSDTTFRLYDYGRPRELHLEESIAASHPVPYVAPFAPHDLAPGRRLLVDASAFVLERWAGPRTVAMPATGGGAAWLIPVSGGGTVDGAPFAAGGVWLIEGSATVTLEDASDLLVAYRGAVMPLDGAEGR